MGIFVTSRTRGGFFVKMGEIMHTKICSPLQLHRVYELAYPHNSVVEPTIRMPLTQCKKTAAPRHSPPPLLRPPFERLRSNVATRFHIRQELRL